MNDLLNWQDINNETIQNLVHLIRIDTVNPPGNELPAILAIKEMLLRSGFPEEDMVILEPVPGRANLIARLRGDGSKRPLLLSGHVDVVPVEREHWTRDPFGGEIADGAIWGRGAFDMKGFVAMYLQVFLLAFRRKLPLKRDLIFAAIADEENGFRYGSTFLSEEHSELIDAEYGLTEGGAMTMYLGKQRAYPIQAAEKSVCWLRMTANGTPGHASVPHQDNAVLYLAQAIERIRRQKTLPVHITPTFRKMAQAIAVQAGMPLGLLMRLMTVPALAHWVIRRLPPSVGGLIGALVSNTCAPTVLKASGKTNVIPSSAEAHLDCRLLPGQTPQQVMEEIYQITGRKVQLEPMMTTNGAEFSTETVLYHLLEDATRQMDPGGIVFPMVMMGATDASQYQKTGMIVYGFTPGMLPPDFPVMKIAHGHDERIPISYIESGLPVLWDVVNRFLVT